MDIQIETKNLNINKDEIIAMRSEAGKVLDALWSGNEAMTGWVQAPLKQDADELEYIKNLADLIKHEAELLVVLGVGGSYLGAKAAIEALPKYEHGINVMFLGNNFCTDYYREALEEIRQKKVMVCVVSKSGNTTEVRAAFEILKPLLEEKYGSEEAAAKRIVVITDPDKGDLRKEAEDKGYFSLSIPSDIGGRYSVLTPAGLLPMAVSGIDISELLRGAKEMAASPAWDDDGADYAIARYILQQKGKVIESIELCHSRLVFLGEWMKQLYGESEGKGGKGLWPVTLVFSTDLHAMGQYLQQGRQNFMETMIIVDNPEYVIQVPEGSLKGKSILDLNRAMVRGAVEAHSKIGIPVVEIHMPRLDAFSYGQLLYFLETTCAITATLSGVNPFDQPGVEAYKREMRNALGE